MASTWSVLLEGALMGGHMHMWLELLMLALEEIEEAFSLSAERYLSRKSSRLQVDVVKKLGESSRRISAGRMAAADKSSF